jgi:O-methyltransferase involved in polyketide biosynthesis
VKPIPVDLSGVPETLLWNLGRRAAAARTGASQDPLAIEVVDRLQYDFTDASRGARWHAVRVATFDAAVRRFLGSHPAGLVVALGEGLETQFWRLDNGRMRWLTVDLPATLDLRHRVLPEEPRQKSHAGSALELGWLDQLDPAEPVLITAQGLLVYFQRNEVHELIAAIAERLPGSSLVFDVVPEKMLELVRRQPSRERDQAVELWSWLFNPEERAAIRRIRGVTGIRDLVPPLAPGVVPLALGAVRRLPRRVRYALPVLPVLQVKFRPVHPTHDGGLSYIAGDGGRRAAAEHVRAVH